MIRLIIFLFIHLFSLSSFGQDKPNNKKFDTALYERASTLCYTNPDSALVLVDSLNKYSLDEYDTINYIMVKVVEANAWKLKLNSPKVDSVLKLAEIRTLKSGRKSEGYNTFLLFKAISIVDDLEEEKKIYKEIIANTDTSWLNCFVFKTKPIINLAGIERKLGNEYQSFLYLEESEKNIEKYKHRTSESIARGIKFQVYNQLGIWMKEILEYENAKSYYNQAKDLYSSDHHYYHTAYSNYLNVLIKQDSFDRVIELSQHYLDNVDDKKISRGIYQKIIKCLIKKGNYKETKKYLDLYIDLYPLEKMSASDTCTYYALLGHYLLDTGQRNEANNYLNQVIKINKRRGYNTPIETKEKYIRSVFQKDNAKDSILINYLSEANKKSIAQTKNIAKKWETKYQTQKKETENQLLKKDNAIANAKLTQQRTLFGGSIITILSLGFLIRNLINRNKERKKHIESLNKKNEAIQALNQEISHRTKNHMALAAALLSKDKRKSDNPQVRTILNENENRLRTLALVNKKLNSVSIQDKINLKDYLQELCDDLIFSLRNDRDASIQLLCPEIELDSEKALRLGLITNELITNSFKHAQTEKNNLSLSLKIEATSTDELIYSYSDNGINKAEVQKDTSISQGIGLIESLWNQLNGTFTYSMIPNYKMEGSIFFVRNIP